MPTNVRDPRTIITPDAFGISDDLLGTPLAPPSRRLWALLVDLAAIAFLTAMFEGIALFIWGAVALFLLWVATSRSGGGTSPEGRAVTKLLRVSLGCLGAAILGSVLLAWFVVRLANDPPGLDPEVPEIGAGVGEVADVLEELESESESGESITMSGGEVARAVLQGLQGRSALGRADDAEEAGEAAVEILEATEGTGMGRDDRLALLQGLTPTDASWADEADSIYERALDRWGGPPDAPGADPSDPDDPADAAPDAPTTAASDSAAGAEGRAEARPAGPRTAEEVGALDAAEAVAAYADALRADSADAPPPEVEQALRRRVASLAAADTLTVLREEIVELRDDVEDLEDDLAAEEERRREIAESRENSLVALLRDIWEQLGSAIGLWSIYFTILLTVLNGQTPGKKLFGLRVVRLDGERMGWFAAFERAGGYIAGLATGLLGFAQVYWDPNRQCIHDKIVGTVVVDTRAPRVAGAWQEAWSDTGARPPHDPGDAPRTHTSPPDSSPEAPQA